MKKKAIFRFQSLLYKLLSAIFLSVCIIFSICVYRSFADVPCMINYQGRLIENNVPVSGPKTMVFSIYDSLEGGTELWTSGEKTIQVHNGLFRHVLGEGFVGVNPVADLSSINWTAGEVLYLEVTVGGETLSPREPIYAYPYAINSHLLEGHTTTHFLDVSGSTQTKKGGLNIMGNLGIGTSEPGNWKLNVAGGDDSFTWGGDHSSNDTPYIKIGDLQICWGQVFIDGPASGSEKIEFPVSFSETPRVIVNRLSRGNYGNHPDFHIYVYSVSSGSFKLQWYGAVDSWGGPDNEYVHYHDWIAIGKWR